MRRNFAHLLFGLLTMLGILLCNDTRSQSGDTIAAINLPLSREDLSLYDFASARMETDKTEIPPSDITKRKFQPVKEIFEKDELHFADSIKSFWIKFQIANDQASDTTISLIFPGVSKAILYKAEGDGLVLIGKAGFVIAVLKRDRDYQENRIDILLKAHSQTTCFIQVILFQFGWIPKMPVLQNFTYAEMKAFSFDREVKHPELLWDHFFTGIFFMFFVFGFIKYLVLGKDRAYLYYSLMGLFSALLSVAQSAYPPLELRFFENLRGIELFDLVQTLGFAMQGLFILEILQLKIKYPRITRVIKWYLFASVLLAITNTTMWLAITNTIAWNLSAKTRDLFKWIETWWAFFNLFLMLGWVVYLATIRKGFYRFIFFGAVIIFIASVLIFAIRFFNLYYLLPPWFGDDPRASTGHLMQIALLIDMCFYFTGLAHRDRQVEKDKIKFQEESIRQLEANKKFQEQFTAELEQQVKEKTAEVVKEKAEVENTLQELRSTQAQLIQSEKMASLGELTAGIAHEIQNPLNFVNNFSEVNNELIDEMNIEIDKGNNEEVKIIASDIKQNLEKINHHGKRADAIVKGMLQHSSAGTGIKEPTDINKLADEYLRLVYHGVRAKDKLFHPTLKTDYDERIGNINIIPQDIGKVILNLINNAFYAVTEKGKLRQEGYEPTVSVGTKKNGSRVEICVKDNGNGIPQKIIDKIFQPFFTTKPTGQGTGLGLSLSYDIIKAHGGEIKVTTSEGEGSEFLIHLPIT